MRLWTVRLTFMLLDKEEEVSYDAEVSATNSWTAIRKAVAVVGAEHGYVPDEFAAAVKPTGSIARLVEDDEA